MRWRNLSSHQNHLRVIINMDFVVYLLVVHLVGFHNEIVYQVPVPEPSTTVSKGY